MITRIRGKLGNFLAQRKAGDSRLTSIHDFEIAKSWQLFPDRSSNPLTANPRKYWSQSDEDGILAAINSRIGLERGSFIEIGSGDGTQNNTLALLATGWRGGWVDAIELAFKLNPVSDKLKFIKSWVTVHNITSLIESLLADLQLTEFDLLSLDLDGNDYHLISKILNSNFQPRIIVLEYNARFPETAEWVMPLNPNHIWVSDDYFGASLASYTNLLKDFGYILVACSAQGSNAFYVHEKNAKYFTDVPKSIEEIYQPPVYHLINSWGAKPSAKTIEVIVN